MWIWVLVISEIHHFPDKPKDFLFEYIKSIIFVVWKR